MSKILKNQTASAILLDIGITVPASGQVTITPQDYDEAAASDDLVTFIGSGDIIVNNGSEDLSKSNAIRLIQGGQTNKVQLDEDLLDTDRIKVLVNYDPTTVDHGLIAGLADDDHPQYLNESRHDSLPQDNPHGVTKAQVGLGNVPNVDATLRANHTGTQLASTISDFSTAVLAAETTTSISLNSNILTYTDEDGVDTDIDLSLYLDDTNLARLVSGTLDPVTGIVTFTRDDSTTFTIDFSALNDQAAIGAAIAAHEADPDPHPQYLTTAEGTSLVTAHEAASDPHPQYQTSTEVQSQVDAHANLTNNPHNVTKAQVGLGNVDNTSDLNKPISTATQTALNNKQNLDSDLTAVAGLSTTGLVTRTGAGSATTRQITAGAGVSVANGSGVSGDPTVTNTDRGSVAVSAHEAAGDPHPQYTTTAEASAAAPVQSVNGETGTLVNYAKTNQNNNFSESQTVRKTTGIAAVEIDSDDNAALTIYRAASNLWSVGLDDFALSNQLRFTNTNGMSAGVQMALDTGSLDIYDKQLLRVNTPVNAKDGANKSYVDAGDIFGSNYQYFEDLTPFSTTSGSNQNAATFTTASIPAGTYRINLQWNFTLNNIFSSAFFEMYVGGVLQNQPIQVELKDSTDDITYSIFQNVVLTAGPKSIQLRTRTENGATVTIPAVKCDIWRVA